MALLLRKVELSVSILLLLCLSAGAQESVRRGHYGLPVDHSHRFIISHTQLSSADFERTALTEPRVLYNWIVRHPETVRRDFEPDFLGYRPPLHSIARRPRMAVDWHFPLGSGTIPIDSAPSKYSFNVNQTPSCANDYVVYGLNVAGGATQPNLIGFNNLYVNATGTGYCSGTAPKVAFAYNITGSGGNGSILSSAALSLDGTKIAFIESVTTSIAGVPCNAPCSIFHVLTVGSGAGNGSFSTVTNTYTAAVPGVGNGASVTSLVFSHHLNTLSFPFVDYFNDVAYFGDDSGNIYKTTCVFGSGCTPALATGYSSGSGIAVSAGNVLTGPIVDTNANRLLVGSSDGKVYIVNLSTCSGTPVSCSGIASLQVGYAKGDAHCSGVSNYSGLQDPPVVDTTFQIWFDEAACAPTNAGDAAMVEGDYSGTAQGPGILMKGGPYNIHAGGLDDNYYNNNAVGNASVSGDIFFLGPNASKQLVLYGAAMVPKTAGTPISISNPPVVSATVNNSAVPGNGPSEPSAITIVQNGNSDWLFFGQTNVPKNSCNNTNVAGEGCVFSYNVFNSTGGSTIPTTNTALASEAAGTSGIVVDNTANSATYPGASSIYFANQATTSLNATTPVCSTGISPATTAAYCAVKLTQAALQ